MAKTIKMSLSKSSVEAAIKQLKAYKQELGDKNYEFTRRLAEIGIPVINRNVSAANGDSDKNHQTYVKMSTFGDYAMATLVCEGKDILFIEFGAGVHYNGEAGSSPHPKGAELGYTIGSYGKGYGKYDSWHYIDDSGALVESHGTQATMPVYKASIEIRNKVLRVAREVFGNG